jgi:hypothetical protein
MSLILSGTDGLSDVDGSAATPAIRGTDANTGIFFPAADTIAFATGGTEDARFNSAGNLQTLGTISVGNATPSTSGAGITFPAAQSASSDANTLDDYEEGTFTPTVSFAMASVGLTYASRLAIYTKVGRVVTFQLLIELSNKGSSTGYVTIGNLPFTVNSISGACSFYISTGLPMGSRIIGTDIYIYKASGANFTNFDSSDVTNSTLFSLCGSYQV